MRKGNTRIAKKKTTLPTLYQVTIFECGTPEHEREYTIYGFESQPEAWDYLTDEMERAEKFFGKRVDGSVYEMCGVDVDRLYGWKYRKEENHDGSAEID